MQRLRGFAVSWFFAPYLGSADLDFFKRIKDTHVDYTVMLARREASEPSILDFATSATFELCEVVTRYGAPRERGTRDDFRNACLQRFNKIPDEFDFIISHSNEMNSHAVARDIKRKHPKLPWIAYFGDLFRANPYIRYIPGYSLVDEDNQTEADAIVEADIIILNNTYQRDLMFQGDLAKYAHKARVVPHCYDPCMYPAAEPDPRKHVFRFAHLGTLYHAKRTAEPLIRAVDRLVNIYPEYKERFEVVFYGPLPCSHDISVHAFMKQRNQVRFEGPVSYTESLRIMQQSDVLVLIDGIFNLKEDGIDVNPFFAGKLVDYFGARKPVMAITMAKGPSADILRETGNEIADLNIDRVAYVLKKHIDGRVKVDYERYAEYGCMHVATQMQSAITEAVAGGNANV